LLLGAKGRTLVTKKGVSGCARPPDAAKVGQQMVANICPMSRCTSRGSRTRQAPGADTARPAASTGSRDAVTASDDLLATRKQPRTVRQDGPPTASFGPDAARDCTFAPPTKKSPSRTHASPVRVRVYSYEVTV